MGSPHSSYAVFDRRLDRRRWDRPGHETAICDGISVFHDGDAEAGIFSWSQGTNNDLLLTLYKFDGSYVSVSAGMPGEVSSGLTAATPISVTLDADATRPLATYVRLNADLDGDQRNAVDLIVTERGRRVIKFKAGQLVLADLSAANIWVDVIFSRPAVSEIAITRISIAAEQGE